jgi:diguanylate cyclase (GGDEF)-like protein
MVVEDEDGAFLEGLLAIGWFAAEPPFDEAPDTILALSDLAAVAIRQARLRNSAWERSDHADRLLHTDRLTGLANRVTFERMLELEIARATRQNTPLAVVLLDVDGLSGISERKGARVADEVLRHVAAAIADRVRLLDTVARFGEDEFVVIAPGDAGGIVALRLRDAIAELPPIGEVEISVSAAVVHHPADGATGASSICRLRGWAMRPQCMICRNIFAPLACTAAVTPFHAETCSAVWIPGVRQYPWPAKLGCVPSAITRPAPERCE